MALKVSEIRAWLDQLDDDDIVGIDEDCFNLTLSDERYGELSLEIGMALSSESVERQERRWRSSAS